MPAPIGNQNAIGNSGKPPKFTTPEDLETAIDQWLQDVPEGRRTITGLCLWLGFESRQSFYDYEKKVEYTYVIKNARLIVENDYELSLRSINVTGSIFALKNMGWTDKTTSEITGKGGAPLIAPIIHIQQLPADGPISETDEDSPAVQ